MSSYDLDTLIANSKYVTCPTTVGLMSSELRDALYVCDKNLNNRVEKAIKANMTSRIRVEPPEVGYLFSVARLHGDIIVTDNRSLYIQKTSNILKKLVNLAINLILLVKVNYGISRRVI